MVVGGAAGALQLLWLGGAPVMTADGGGTEELCK